MKLIHATFLLSLLAAALHAPNPMPVKGMVVLILIFSLWTICSK